MYLQLHVCVINNSGNFCIIGVSVGEALHQSCAHYAIKLISQDGPLQIPLGVHMLSLIRIIGEIGNFKL